MPPLILTLFLFHLFLYVVSALGADRIAAFLWNVYTVFPTQMAHQAKQQVQLRREVVRQRRELSGVSAQDDFARWAKLRRQLDKSTAELEEMDAALMATRTALSTAIRSALVGGPMLLRLVVQWRYSKTPIYWLPTGLVPWPIEWIISFPRAPLGSVSVSTWGAACGGVVDLAGKGIAWGATCALGREEKDSGTGNGNTEGEKVEGS